MLKMEDLIPVEYNFKLSGHPGKEYTLKKFSLASQIWLRGQFGSSEKVQQIFKTMDLVAISQIAHHLLKDKTDFKTYMDFAESIITHDDKVQLLKGVLATIGISQPVLDDAEKEVIAEQEKKDAQNPNE